MMTEKIEHDDMTHESLATLPVQQLAEMTSMLVEDMACVSIAASRSRDEMDESAIQHPDTACREEVGMVRALRRRADTLAERLRAANRTIQRLRSLLMRGSRLMPGDTDARSRWLSDADTEIRGGPAWYEIPPGELPCE